MKADRIKKSIIKYKLLSTSDELRQVRDLESSIWGRNEIIPIHQTLAAMRSGGFIFGACIKDEVIGFLYSFPGYDGHSIYLYSHILGVVPEYRNCGIGEKLKRCQWLRGKKMGYPYITWTYDLLESLNAYFNIHKLGAVCSTYIENCYGEMNDRLNKGLPSDRFLVRWDTKQKRKKSIGKVTFKEAARLNVIEWDLGKNNIPIVNKIKLKHFEDESFLTVSIPAFFQRIKKISPEVALDWRMKTRKLFQYYFKNGWQVTGFLKNRESSAVIHYYILTRNTK